MKVKYRKGYKYQLAEDFGIKVNIEFLIDVKTDYISLSHLGHLVIRKGYAWDGPSGPTFDTKNSIRASLVHDALYELIRKGLLGYSCREEADRILYKLCKEDGMYTWRAWLWYRAVRRLAFNAASPAEIKKVITAP